MAMLGSAPCSRKNYGDKDMLSFNHPAGVSRRIGQRASRHVAFAPKEGARPPDLFFCRGHRWVHLRYGLVTHSPSYTMALSIGFTRFVASADATQVTGLLTFAPVGLSPTEHASLCWTHPFAKIPQRD